MIHGIAARISGRNASVIAFFSSAKVCLSSSSFLACWRTSSPALAAALPAEEIRRIKPAIAATAATMRTIIPIVSAFPIPARTFPTLFPKPKNAFPAPLREFPIFAMPSLTPAVSIRVSNLIVPS